MLKLIRFIAGTAFSGVFALTNPVGGAMRGAVRQCFGERAISRVDATLDAIMPAWIDTALNWGYDASVNYCASARVVKRCLATRIGAFRNR